jgi:feruloyl-CoA synthase
VARAILLEEPPSIDANEVTDQGSIGQRAVLTGRADLVAGLDTEPYSLRVLIAAAGR